MELPFSFQSYESRSLPYSAQRLINMYYETGAPGTKTKGILFNRPGKTLFSAAGTGPIRGIETMKGVPFVVSGSAVYTLEENGDSTLIDAIPGADRVSMSNNGTQVAIATDTDGYIVTASTVTKITDTDFPKVTSVTFQDGYFIWSIVNTGEIQLSSLLDGLEYDSLDRATAEVAPDNLVAVFADHDDLFLMGEDTIEPWYNSGDVDTPFVPQGGALIEVGLVARDTVAKLDNSIFWLGNAGERGGLTAWRASGYAPVRISTHALETKWESVSDVSLSYASSFRFEGHDFYVLTIPKAGTFVYDASTQFWCEWITRDETDFDVVGFSDAFGERLMGSATTGKINRLSVDTYTDNGALITRQATSPPLATDNNYYARHNFVRIDTERGVGLTKVVNRAGENWTLQISAEDNRWPSVTFGGGLFVAISNSSASNQVMTSPNGINWTARTSAVDNAWLSVTFGGGLFVAVATTGIGNRVMTSLDGSTWTSQLSAADNGWVSVTFGNNLFVAVSFNGAGNRVMTSSNGSDWAIQASAADNSWQSITFGNGLFVAVSDSGIGNRVMTSLDGSTWTSQLSAADNNWHSIVFGNGLFVAVADTGLGNRVMTSSNGSDWAIQASAADNSWQSITFGNGLFVAGAASGTGNRVMTSPDGITWTSQLSAADNDWFGLTFGNNLFVATSLTGANNRVMTSNASDIQKEGGDPKLSLRWSDEDGVLFGNWHEMPMGKIGETKRRSFLRRLGIARSRIYQLRISDPVKTAILGAYVDLTVGVS